MDMMGNVLFLENGTMPSKPTGQPSIIVTMDKAVKLGLTACGWTPTVNGMMNPRVGKIDHRYVISLDTDGNPTGKGYDIMAWWDGKQTDDGQTIPGEVFAPILWCPKNPNMPKSKDNPEIPWVLWFWEWRSTMMDWIPTIPGGFEPAKQESLEEAGLEIESYDSVEICGNRANVMSLTKVGFGAFRIGTEPKPEKTEAIFIKARYATPLKNFPFTKDSLVNNAIAYARSKLIK